MSLGLGRDRGLGQALCPGRGLLFGLSLGLSPCQDRDFSLAPGSGLCNAEISFLNCYSKYRPDMDINVDEMKYTQNEDDSILWVNPLNYFEPAMEHTKCSGQGNNV